MTLLTHAHTHPTTAITADPATLTPAQRTLADTTLWELGIEDGLVVDDGGTRDAYTRLALSAATAAALAIQLPAGDELTQCAACHTITATTNARETSDRWLCTLADPDGTSCYTRHPE